MSTAASTSLRPVFITGGLKLGGSTTLLLNLCTEFVKRGIDHLVISLSPEHPMESDFQKAGIPLRRIDGKPRIAEDMVRWGLDVCREFGPSHAIGWLGPLSYEVLRYVPRSIPRLAMAHSDEPLVYKALAWYSKEITATVSVSQAICETIKQTPGLDRLPAHCEPCGIPVPEWVRSPDHSEILSGRPIRILYLGRLGRVQKRVHLFPSVYRDLCASGRPFHWTIVGEGPDGEWLRNALPPASGAQSVEYTGPVSYAQVPALLKNHDIFLLASSYEGLPLSLLEAMVYGLVPVVSDLESGVGQVVDDSTAIRVPPEEVEKYAEGILALDADRKRLVAMGIATRNKVALDFSSYAMAEKWLRLLETYKTHPSSSSWPKRITAFLPLQGNPLFSFYLQPLRRAILKLRTLHH